jgi:hypothetical protein
MLMKTVVKHLKIPVIHFKYPVKVIAVSISQFLLVFENQLLILDITGGPALDEYQFLQFHMHWGSNDNEGSEHVIDGIRLPAEVRRHLVISTKVSCV